MVSVFSISAICYAQNEVSLQFYEHYRIEAARRVNGIGAGDLNNDNNIDLVIPSYDDNILVFLGNGGGSFGSPSVYNGGYRENATPLIADFNYDGFLDAAICNNDGRSFTLLIGDGTGNLSTHFTGNTSRYPEITMGDFNDDGKLDIASSSWLGNIMTVFINNGDGTFNSHSYGVGAGMFGIAAGDYNGDGKTDLVVTVYYSHIIIQFWGNGDGTFTQGNAIPVPNGEKPVRAWAADFNNDGVDDLAVQSANDDWYYSIQIYLGTQGGELTYNHSSVNNLGQSVIGHVNNDDFIDIVSGGANSKNVYISVGNGDGSFTESLLFSYPQNDNVNCGYVELGDFNNDGLNDIAVGLHSVDSVNAFISILLNTLAPPLTLTSPNGSESWDAGSTQNITWTSSDVANVKLEYSTNNGSDWKTIVVSTDASMGSYNWIVPSISSSNCLVRISDISDQSISDQSDGTFSISAEPSEPVYGTQITFSGKAKSWRADWSPDGNWIAYSEKGDDDLYKIWIVPSTGGEPINRTGHIDGYHSKPNFTVDSKEVMFSNQGIDPNDESDYRIESIDIYSKAHRIILDNAQNGAWSHDGRYLAYRTAPGMDLYVWDTKTDKHQFIAAEDVISYPVQTFSPDDSYIITQRDVDGEVKLFKIPTQGGQFEQITSSESNHWYPNISGNGNWILYTRLWEKEILVYNTVSGVSQELFPGSPYIIQGASFSPDCSKFCYFRENTKGSGIFEVFVADFPFGIINVMSPNGGEEWTAGTVNTISWTYENVENVRIEYSADGGATWNEIITKTASDGEYNWLDWVAPSSNCLVRITDTTNPDITDQSAGNMVKTPSL